MAPLVLLHLGVMIYATQGELRVADILSRTQGSLFWGLIYGVFVLAVAIHAAIGLRIILLETFHLSERFLNGFTLVTGLVLLALGGWAVFAVVMA